MCVWYWRYKMRYPREVDILCLSIPASCSESFQNLESLENLKLYSYLVNNIMDSYLYLYCEL